MSQSNSNSESHTPKRIARAHRHRPDTSDDESDDGPEPACRSRSTGAGVDTREWREIVYSERALSSYRACEWPECFPNGPPDEDDEITVVRSCSHPTTYHRPRADHALSDTGQGDGSTDSHTNTLGSTQDTTTREPLRSIADLREGEGVVWDGQQSPMRVIDIASESTGAVSLVGPNGGEYRIEGRPNKVRQYVVYPGVGVVTNVYCIEPVRDRLEMV